MILEPDGIDEEEQPTPPVNLSPAFTVPEPLGPLSRPLLRLLVLILKLESRAATTEIKIQTQTLVFLSLQISLSPFPPWKCTYWKRRDEIVDDKREVMPPTPLLILYVIMIVYVIFAIVT